MPWLGKSSLKCAGFTAPTSSEVQPDGKPQPTRFWHHVHSSFGVTVALKRSRNSLLKHEGGTHHPLTHLCLQHMSSTNTVLPAKLLVSVPVVNLGGQVLQIIQEQSLNDCPWSKKTKITIEKIKRLWISLNDAKFCPALIERSNGSGLPELLSRRHLNGRLAQFDFFFCVSD